MSDQEIRQANLLGHSMGGKVAMEFAGSFPEMVSRLIVVDIAPRAYDERHNLFLEEMSSLGPEQYSSREQIDEAFAKTVRDVKVRQFLLTNLQRTPHGFEWKVNLQAIRANYAAIMGAVTASGPFTGPALFIRGERSDYLREEDLPLIQTMFPKAEFATIPGAGHWVHAEAPDEFRRIVLGFLTDDK